MLIEPGSAIAGNSFVKVQVQIELVFAAVCRVEAISPHEEERENIR
jgi:hypothetical protein